MTPKPITENTLFYGDNLPILREYVADDSIDLVYLDPPFNSNATYNVLFAEKTGKKSEAQIRAFEDTWEWDEAAAKACDEIVQHGGQPCEAIKAFRQLLGTSNMMAYLAMMGIRMIELHRVLKPTGSIYLHCDPTASHYLKVLMDAVFGSAGFRHEIVWRRTTIHGDAKGCGNVHDTILFFSKTDEYTWNRTFQSYNQEYIAAYYRYQDPNGRRFMSADLTGAGAGPARVFGDKGEIAPPANRHWMYDQEGINKKIAEDRIFWTRNGVPRLKAYLDEARGMPLQDVWDDIQALRSWHTEKLGYPTQKPLALLERIIEASSNPGDVVLDPFCGAPRGALWIMPQPTKRERRVAEVSRAGGIPQCCRG